MHFGTFDLAYLLPFIGVGFAAIVLNDYSRQVRPLVTEMTPAGATVKGRERFRLAA